MNRWMYGIYLLYVWMDHVMYPHDITSCLQHSNLQDPNQPRDLAHPDDIRRRTVPHSTVSSTVALLAIPNLVVTAILVTYYLLLPTGLD